METRVAGPPITATFAALWCAIEGPAAFETCIAGATVGAAGLACRHAGSVITTSDIASVGAASLGDFELLSARSRAWLCVETHHYTTHSQGHKLAVVCPAVSFLLPRGAIRCSYSMGDWIRSTFEQWEHSWWL